MTLRTPAIAAASALALLPAASLATDSLALLAVADPPGPSAELAEMTHQLRSILAERTGGVVEASQLRERMTGQSSAASLSELDRAYAGALATYQSGDFEGSIRTLQAVIQDLEKMPEGSETFEQWKRAMMRLARAQGTVGQRSEEKATLERLVRAAPSVKADPSQYPPSFEKRIAEVRAELRARPARKLRITSNGEQPVTVFVQGRMVGSTPVTLSVPSGKYRVAGAQRELRVPAVTADLTEADQSIVLDLQLMQALRPNSGPGLALSAKDRALRLVTIGAWLGADKVLAVSISSDREVNYLDAVLYDIRRGMLQRQGNIRLTGMTPPPGSLTALASFLITGRDSTNTVVATAETPRPVPVEAEPPSRTGPVKVDLNPSPKPAAGQSEPVAGATRTSEPSSLRSGRAMGWAAVGAGGLALVLGGVAVIEGFSARSSYDSARGMVGPGGVFNPGADATSYNGRIRDGDSARNVALATGIGAGVSLVAAGVLGYLSYQQTGEIGPFRF